MYHAVVTNPNPSTVQASLTFRLGTLGAIITERFAQRIARLDLKPKHLGVLVGLQSGTPASQQELAKRMGVAPSLMVSLADHLESLEAVARVRDPRDRRRQVLTLTATGRDLLAEAGALTAELDRELTAGLTGTEAPVLRHALGKLASDAGIPVEALSAESTSEARTAPLRQLLLPPPGPGLRRPAIAVDHPKRTGIGRGTTARPPLRKSAVSVTGSRSCTSGRQFTVVCRWSPEVRQFQYDPAG